MQKKPIWFYGRMWMVLAGTLIVGHLAVFGCVMGPLFWLDIIKSANGHPGYEAGIPLTIIGLLLMPIAIAFAFQVFALQRPILKICKEGLWIRSIGTRYEIDPVLTILGFDLILIIFIMLWQLMTLQMFRIKVIHWQWDHFDLLPKYGIFSVTGWLDKDNKNDFEQGTPVPYTVSYGADSFSVSIDIVRKTIQFYIHNPDSRETLPSWQDDETMFG